MTQVWVDELLPQLPEGAVERRAILGRARQIVREHWNTDADPVLAMALQVAVQLPAQRARALAALDEMEKAAHDVQAPRRAVDASWLPGRTAHAVLIALATAVFLGVWLLPPSPLGRDAIAAVVHAPYRN